jgi:hypothetical protein
MESIGVTDEWGFSLWSGSIFVYLPKGLDRKNRMKIAMKTLIILVLQVIGLTAYGQEIVGKWQLVKESTCIEDDLDASSAEEEEIIREMKSMAGATPQVVEFKDNNSAEETTKIFNRRKSYNSNALMYKYTGEALHLLDKKSRTIIDSFTVEQLSADSLIISNAQRACETRVFVKIK